ncbi:MAG: ABC transporter permease [Chloroflexi bacterium]|nr:ABC transporter permease [Chloroflexota bacterium]
MTAVTEPLSTTQSTQPNRLLALLRGIVGSQEFVLFASIIVLLIVVGADSPRYLAERNLTSILQGNAYIAVAAIGMAMVIISGNIDISVGSLIGVLATISGSLAVAGFPIWLSWLAPLFFGALVGAFNGFLIAYLRIPAIVVTLGMLSILKGGLIVVTNGQWITDLPDGYALSQMRPLGIPMPIYFMVVLTILAALWMRYSPTGRAIYAVGGNKEAARLSGISERRITMTVFIINGVMVGIASVLFATQLSVIQSTVPPNLELTIITVTVVGGVSILGGTGTVIGALFAAILLSAIGSALVFIDAIPVFWLRAVQGLLILGTVLADMLRRRRQMLNIRG